ncbi:PaaX family transcriptional regulator C-terminal domain-containing protein [Nocardia sp. CA-107356]|uniref:PaaX family transcriptional regulator C-terminal domain-containing protein n=1 Tax=Nocardia sp. CA-107356 TaxID=3239972 RepID=UPI003D8B3E92
MAAAARGAAIVQARVEQCPTHRSARGEPAAAPAHRHALRQVRDGQLAFGVGIGQADGASRRAPHSPPTCERSRKLPCLDPGLPIELLPDDRSGVRAADLFSELRRDLVGPAHDFAASVSGSKN